MFKKVLWSWDLAVKGQVNQPNYVQNFYGLGNETKLLTKSRDFYRVRIDQLIASAGIQNTFQTIHTIRLLGDFLSAQVEENPDRFVSKSNPAIDSAAFSKTTWVGGTVAYELSTVNKVNFPRRGVVWSNRLQYLHADYPSLSLTVPTSSISFYFPLGSWVFATRIGGATLWGTPRFFQYNQLGGSENLRGYRRSRFYGKTTLYNNNELRIPLAYIRSLLINGKLGATLFCDNGRVWIPNENSDQWHWGYGGGFWLLPFDRIAITANVGFSKEDRIFTIKTGFLF